MKPLDKKAPAKHKNLTDIRVTRKSNVHVHAGDGHGWAVSYADLLMVLLSFFILYFNFSDGTGPGNGEAEFRRIVFAGKGASSAQGSGSGTGNNRKPAMTNQTEGVADLAEKLKVKGVNLTAESDRIVIDLERASFDSGEFAIPKMMASEVDEMIEILKPHLKDITITVIGHTDPRPLRPRSRLLQDNFDLSSVRALTVLKYMIKSGIPGNRGSARAASSYDRAARAVSLEVRLVVQSSQEGES